MKNNKILFSVLGLVALTIGVAIWQKRRIIIHAKRFLGMDEIGDNMGWKDPSFKKKMQAVGWTLGSSWCVFFVKAMWADVYPVLKTKLFNGKKLIDYVTGNSQTTYTNMQNLQAQTGWFKVVGIPRAGDMVVWQNYNSSGKGTSQGHVGIVSKVKGDTFNTIEANTSELGNPEETVNTKIHTVGEMSRKTGLRLKGFIRYTLA